MKRLTLLLLSASLILGLTLSCEKQPTTPSVAADTGHYPVIMGEPELSTFASLLKTANLLDFFHGSGPFTAFAPSNAAFEKFNQKTLEALKEPENKDQLINLINYHVILGKHLSKNLKSGTVHTINGKDLTIRVENGQIWVNDAKVTRADLVGPNFVTHLIDTVLVP